MPGSGYHTIFTTKDAMGKFMPFLIRGSFAAGLLFLIFAGYDILFSAPRHLEGTLIEKIFVPARTATTLSGGHKTYPGVKVERVDQWIGIVKMESGDTLIVHCLMDHYNKKNVGDILHFKRYEGEHLHIQYLAHNEEEDSD